MKNKKILRVLMLGTAIVMPMAAIISCGTSAPDETNNGNANPKTENSANGGNQNAKPATGNSGGTITGGGNPNAKPTTGNSGGTITGGGNQNAKPATGNSGGTIAGETQQGPENQKPLGDNQAPNLGVNVQNDGVIISSDPMEITDDFGEGNIANPELTRKLISRNLMEYKTRKATGQPFALHYHPRDLVAWKAGADSDDAFNISTVPLKNRVLAGRILATQRDRQLQILAGLSADTSETELGTVAKSNTNQRIFQMWSKVTSFVGWGGSASEGNFIVPKGDDINAAHRNGVPLLGTMFLAPGNFGGSEADYDALSVKNSDGTFPVADSMVAMANHFGFDGWFLNLETLGPTIQDHNSDTFKNFSEFLNYLHNKMAASKQITVMYDAGVGKSFMEDPASTPYDQVAMDYSSWSTTYPGVTKGQMEYGYNYDTDEIKQQVQSMTDEDRNVWLYTYFKRHGILDGDEIDLKLFSDSEGSENPRTHMNQFDEHLATLKSLGEKLDMIYSRNWVGLSHYFQAHTIINSRIPFSSSFELGVGSSFYVNGVKQEMDGDFRNQGLQDVLPTYTWILDEYDNDHDFTVDTRTSKVDWDNTDNVKVQVDETGTPFYGSSNLHYTGSIEASNTIVNRLYGSQVELKTGDEFSVVVDNTELNPKLALWLQDTLDTTIVQEHADIALDAAKTTDLGNGLSKVTYNVPSSINGKTMISFGLAFTNPDSTDKDIDFHVGQINYNPVGINNDVDSTNKVLSVHQDGNFFLLNSAYLRFNWEMKDKSTIDHYVIWSTTGDGFDKKEILSITSLPAVYLENVEKLSKLDFVIDAVDENDKIISSNKVVVKTTWTDSASDEVNQIYS